MYEQFGAIVKQKKVEFQLFLPNSTQYSRGGDPHIQDVRILGNFQSELGGKGWELASAPVMIKHFVLRRPITAYNFFKTLVGES